MKQSRCSKFEFVDDKVYHVVAQCVEIDFKKYVLEIVAVVHDDVWFDTFGHTDFVHQITNYNQQIYLDSFTIPHTLSVENVVVEADTMLYDVKSKGKATYGLNII